MVGVQLAEDQPDSRHVLDAVIPVCRVVQWAGLVDDARRRLLGRDRDRFDLVQPAPHLRVQRERRFDRGLAVELGREVDLEQHVFHDVRAERSLHRERPAAEPPVVESPLRRGKRRRVAHLARHGHERHAHSPARGVAGRPRLARAGVRGLPVGAQSRIEPGVGDGVDHRAPVAAQQPGGDCGRGHLHQQNVVDADPVEAVFERQHALYLVGLDHRRQDVAHRERRIAVGRSRPG